MTPTSLNFVCEIICSQLMSLPSQNSRAVYGLPARSSTGRGVLVGGLEGAQRGGRMMLNGAQRGGGGVWRRCNFQIAKIVDSSFKLLFTMLTSLVVVYMKSRNIHSCTHKCTVTNTEQKIWQIAAITNKRHNINAFMHYVTHRIVSNTNWSHK